MRLVDPPLARALALSLLLHAALFVAAGWVDDPLRRDRTPAPQRLNVELQLPNIPDEWLAEQAMLPFEPARTPPPRKPARSVKAIATATATGDRGETAKRVPGLDEAALRQANAQMARELLYPPEAIARGLEGQALVLLSLDGKGNAVAAQLQASSGHAVLDAAAVRAARTLRALPDAAPREALLPVRFRLY